MRSITEPLSGKFHSQNEITWKLEQRVSSRANSTFSPPKCTTALCTNTFKQAHTHLYTHAIKDVFQFHHHWLCVLNSKPFNQLTDTVIISAPIKCDDSVDYQPAWASAYIDLPTTYSVAAVVRLPARLQSAAVCGSLPGSQQSLIWEPCLRLAVQRDVASQEGSITSCDMCQVYYVLSFIELIYFVAVGFNQGQFMHTGWAVVGELRGTCTWNKTGSQYERNKCCSEKTSAYEASEYD